MDPAEAVHRFLASVGQASEAEFYLQLFRAEAKERFAAIHVEAAVARYAAEAVVLDLRFLSRLGLAPVVVLGVFEPDAAHGHAARLEHQLIRQGVPAMRAGSDADAASAARRGEIPIRVIDRAHGQTVSERFTRLGDLVRALSTNKLIFLSRAGGLRQADRLVPLVNLTTDFDTLVRSRELSRKQLVLLHEARRLIGEVPHKLVAAVTSPLDLLRELFTARGAGTLLRRGATILRYAGFHEVDVPRLRGLIASSFGRPPRDAFFEQPVRRIYLEEGYRGAAILVDTSLGPYLSKFVVDREAQGEGMGRDLWELVAADFPTVFWRARSTNPIGAWYTKLCDGLMRFPAWHVFWRGLSPDQVPAAVAFALAAPVDIPPEEPPPTAISPAG